MVWPAAVVMTVGILMMGVVVVLVVVMVEGVVINGDQFVPPAKMGLLVIGGCDNIAGLRLVGMKSFGESRSGLVSGSPSNG